MSEQLEEQPREQPAFSDVRGCEAWIAALPADPDKSQVAVAATVRAIAGSALPSPTKLELYETLRARVFQAQADRAKRYVGQPIPLPEGLQRAWQDVVGLWRSLGEAYLALIADMAGTAPELAEHAALISQRAIRFTGLAMRECNLAYQAVPAGLWQHLHEPFAFAEIADALESPVEDGAGRSTAATTIRSTYLHALLEQMSQPDSQSVAQMQAVSRWLDRWESLARLSKEPPAPNAAGQVLAIDFSSDHGPGFRAPAPGDSVRFLDTEALAKVLRQSAAALRSKTPAQLGLGDLPRDACERLTMLLHIQWCAAGTGRVDERKPASIRVLVSPNLASVHFHLTGNPFRQPGKEFSSGDRQHMDFMGETVGYAGGMPSQRSQAIDNWDIVNQSASGFLGMSRKANEAVPIRYGQLIGLQPASKSMYLGVIQRLAITTDGGMWVGLRIIPGTPQGAAVRVVPAPGTPIGKFERALLLPDDPARKLTASLVLFAGWFQPNRQLDLHVGTTRRIRLVTLLDQGADYERVTFAEA